MTNDTLITAIMTGQPTVITYTDVDGVISIRTVLAKSIERCTNGNAILRTFDLNRGEPRNFTLANIAAAFVGSTI